MHPVLLVARRDYFAYVGAWGFWLSLVTAPLVIAALLFAPILLARAEPPRAIAVFAERAEDAALVRAAFEERARERAREEVVAYVAATSPSLAGEAIRLFDAAADRGAGVAAVRELVRSRAPNALAAFPTPRPRYLILDPPTTDIEALKRYLIGERVLPNGAALYGAMRIRREENTPVIEYWSKNLSHEEPSQIARLAMRLAMRREALAAQGLDPLEADRLEDFQPRLAQFDPRATEGSGEVTLRQRAPFYAALALAFVLWSVVFSTANMLLTGVIEEKSNKILDTILTSVTPMQILMGKLLGVAAVSATLFLFWGALGGVLLNMAVNQAAESVVGQVASAFLDPRLLAAFGIGFVAGYLMYGVIFLALGSLCESIQEAQTLLGPVALVLAMPMMLIAPALDNPNAPIIEAASWVPLFTPFLLLVRAPAGLSWMEIVGMGGAMVVALIVVLFLASRVFHAGVADQVSLAGLRSRFSRKH
jgi:ABC-2 type transport system permease protein